MPHIYAIGDTNKESNINGGKVHFKWSPKEFSVDMEAKFGKIKIDVTIDEFQMEGNLILHDALDGEGLKVYFEKPPKIDYRCNSPQMPEALVSFIFYFIIH